MNVDQLKSSSSNDHLVSSVQQAKWHNKTKRFGGLEFRRLQDRQVRGFFALNGPSDVWFTPETGHSWLHTPCPLSANNEHHCIRFAADISILYYLPDSRAFISLDSQMTFASDCGRHVSQWGLYHVDCAV